MFRFTIRDLLWLTVVVALGLGWWLDRAEMKAKLIKGEEAQQRVLFYMDIVERLQKENYKLEREASGKQKSSAGRTTYVPPRKSFEALRPRFPEMPDSYENPEWPPSPSARGLNRRDN
jgi:hypothetical protein